MGFDRINTSDPTLSRIQERIDEKVRSFDSRMTSLEGGVATILTVEFAAAGQQTIAHGLGAVPKGWRKIYASDNQGVWDYAAPDKTNFYLQATNTITVKIEVVP